ncbi:MAG: aldo/keto reductase [Betaproteobacteria bacterium]|nr:aldo/keto reductase [Betaproteobacteria bacterium]
MLKLGLGTVQWGTDYGIANRSGMANAETVAGILRLAIASGIGTLDTAAAYGEAEDVLGSQGAAGLGFEIVTKTLPLKGLAQDAAVAARMVRDRFLVSLEKLGTRSVYGLLVHHAADLLGPCGDFVWEVLRGLRREGRVRKIGCSLYHPAELEQLMQRYDIDLVQLPFSIYDQRFLRAGTLASAKERGVEVHARSVFLQGLLLMPEADLPAYFDAIRPRHAKFLGTCRDEGVPPLCAALSFVTGSRWVDKAIVGCESIPQCREILAAAASGRSGAGGCEAFASLALEDEAYTNPGRWPKHA